MKNGEVALWRLGAGSYTVQAFIIITNLTFEKTAAWQSFPWHAPASVSGFYRCTCNKFLGSKFSVTNFYIEDFLSLEVK